LKMRVCLVSSAYRPYISGVGEHVHYLGTELQKLGHEVTVLTSTCQTMEDSELLPAVRLGHGLIVRFGQGEFTIPVGLTLAAQVKHFFTNNHFDIVHCHGIFPPELAYWAARYSPSPVIVTFHIVNPQLPDFICWAFQKIFPNLQLKLKAKIAVSHATEGWAEKFFPGTYWIIPNGVDLNRFHPDAKPALPVGLHPRLLFVGRLEKRKGLEYLIRAMPEVRNKFPDTTLTVVGHGPLRVYFHKLASQLGISDAIQFVGPVPNNRLAPYYTSATIYISPSIGREAMGIVLIEAMACGVPVIASDIVGYNEVIENGVNGILCSPGDVKSLNEAIIHLLSSPALRKSLSTRAIMRAREFDWQVVTQKVVDVYKTVIN